MRLPPGTASTPATQHNRSGAFGQQGFQQYSPSQAQPQQQSQGTPYNPQQGGNFAAYAPRQPASGPTVHQIQQQQLDARRANNAQRAAEFARSQPAKMQPGAPGMMGFQQPAGLSQFAGMNPAGFNPFGNIPPFQFTGTDFMGNRFNNPGDMTAQQGAMVQALNNQRSQQIGNMFTNGAPLSPLNPALAYQQGQQMLGGGFQNPFAAPGMAQPMQQPSFGTPYNPQQDFQFTPPAGAQMARPQASQPSAQAQRRADLLSGKGPIAMPRLQALAR